VEQEYFEGVFGANITVKVTSYFAGGAYELDQSGVVQADLSILISATTTRKYYSFGGQPVAMTTCSGGTCSALTYFLTDHLGSVVATINATGDPASLVEQRYLPFGQARKDVGTITQTDLAFTGQRNMDAQGNGFTLGLLDYHARFFDPALGRWTQPDTVIPDGNPQSLNRYTYVGNSPINFNDPTGHKACDEIDADGNCVKSTAKGDLVTFEAESGQTWSESEKQAINSQYEAVARKLALMMGGFGFSISPIDAFYLVFGGSTTIMKKNTTCSQNHDNSPTANCDAENKGNNTEWVYSNAKSTALTDTHDCARFFL